MNVLDLFSGIGGFSLGLERAGMRTVAFCEIEPYCRAVLKKHWPHVPIYDDVRAVTGPELAAAGISVDVVCGGFPCQDISAAGKRAGLAGARSGLWFEFARILGELRPQYAIVENVSALLHRGLDAVLGDLAALGFDAEWHCIPASAVGAPHRRDRVWIVAHAAGSRCGEGRRQAGGPLRDEARRPQSERRSGDVADAHGARSPCWEGQDTARAREIERAIIERGGEWLAEPNVGRVAHGVPSRVDRLRALGNAVVPQVVEIIGRAIMNTPLIRSERA